MKPLNPSPTLERILDLAEPLDPVAEQSLLLGLITIAEKFTDETEDPRSRG
jgi:hypothetical protein